MYRISKILNPELFQGKYKKKNYFEGWYFKCINSDQKEIVSIIPGISIENNGDTHAFIQIINGRTTETYYIPYHINEFKYCNKSFDILIGKNHFTSRNASLDITCNEITLKGDLFFYNRIPYPKRLLNPGIMGIYQFIPFMECYHGIVNIHHDIHGSLMYNSQVLDFEEGYGYIEKDWGKSFPTSWIWVQSNHFSDKNICLMFSIARIPWFTTSFVGFICFLRMNDKHYTFATYTGAKIKYFNYTKSRLTISLEDNAYKLTLKVKISENEGKLMAPTLGSMNRKIAESINSIVEVNLINQNGDLLYNGIGFHTGTEIAGNIQELMQ